jgi:HD-GYP domain-containing protein (c-di-GMP phosphodiesterase class II)
MMIADIFEALSARDRPYKARKTLSECIDIMTRMSREHHIDPDLFELFLRAGVYKEYADIFLLPDQIDDIDLSRYLGTLHPAQPAAA